MSYLCDLLFITIFVFVQNYLLRKNEMTTACENMCLTKERLTKPIKIIFKEEFERQQQNILNIISRNFDIKIREVRDELKTKHSDLK